MATSIVDSRLLWELRPREVPGVVIDQPTNTAAGRIQMSISLSYPNGQPCQWITYERPRGLVLRDWVMVTLKPAPKPAPEEERTHPDRVVADVVRRVSKGQHDSAVQEFNKSSLAEFENKIRGELERIIRKDLDDEFEPKQSALNADQEKLTKAEASLREKQQAFEQANKDLLAEKAKVGDAQRDIEKKWDQFEQLGGQRLIDTLARNGVDFKSANEVVETGKFTPCPPSLLTELTSNFGRQGYDVSESLLIQTLLCTCVAAAMGQFVVLTGPPGSGKTSLVKKIATALNAGSAAVPVRPAWIDATDLLGFYDSRQGLYQPTPFMDKVVEAKHYSDANRLYFLTLDEMNLARIENYAADLLSRLEKARANEEDAKVFLYSPNLYKRLVSEYDTLIAEWGHLIEIDGKARENDVRVATLFENNNRYPAEMSIPEGLVFFGTINVDDTTYLPSPKFLDRALTVQVADTQLPQKLNKASVSTASSSWTITTEFVRSLNGDTKLPRSADSTWTQLVEWNNKHLKPLGIHLSHRLPEVFRCYMRAASKLGISERMEVADTFILSKILPMVSFRRDEVHKKKALENWYGDVDERKYPLTAAALNKMVGSDALLVRYLE